MSTATAFARRVRKRKLKSDINVVPYIDVMLVLLVIFMITAPLLNLGVDIDLPQSNAKALEAKKEPADANPDVSVILAGDEHVPYGVVANAMNYVSAAGVQKISLLSKPPEGK
jgi:biopolymer transport protein TolR